MVFEFEYNYIPSIEKIAKAYLFNGEFDLSEKYYRQLISLEPDNPKYLTEFGEMFVASNKFIEAEEKFLESININNKYYSPFSFRAFIFGNK